MSQPLAVWLVLYWSIGRNATKSTKRSLSAWLLAVTAIELSLAQMGMIATAPAEHWRTTPALAESIVRDAREREDSSAVPLRAYRSPAWMPKEWAATSSHDRQQIGQAWDHDTLLPKYHLLTDVEMVASSSALRSADVVEFLHAQRNRLQRMVFEQYRIAPASRRIAGEPIVLNDVSDTQLLRVEGTPRAWVVHEIATLPPLNARNADAIWRRSNEVLDLAAARGFGVIAIVESDAEPIAARPSGRQPRESHCQITHYSSERIELNVSLTAPGLVVLADAYEPNWTCFVEAPTRKLVRYVPIVRTNRILRGVALPAGEHRLVFGYWPTSFFIGAIISAIGWLAIAIAGSQRLATCFLAQRRRRDALRPG